MHLMTFQLDIWEIFLAVKWKIELPREAARAPSMDVFRNRLIKPLPGSVHLSCPDESIKSMWIMIFTCRSYTDATRVSWCKRLTAESSKRLIRRCCFLRPCFLLLAFLLVTFPIKTWEIFAASASWRGGKHSAQRTILFSVLQVHFLDSFLLFYYLLWLHLT